MNGATIIALPYALKDDVTGAVLSYLEAVGGIQGSEVTTAQITGDDLGSLKLRPGNHSPRTVAIYERPLPTRDDPATLIVADGRWDLGLAATVSRKVGGFAISAESWTTGAHLGVAAFYAGVTLQTWTNKSLSTKRGRAVNPIDVSKTFQKLLRKAMRLDGLLLEPMLQPSRSTTVEVISARERQDFIPERVPYHFGLDCAFYADADPDRFRYTLEVTPGISGRIAYTSLDVPYGVVLGMRPSQWQQWSSVQSRLSAHSLGFSWVGGSDLQWWSAGPHRLPVIGHIRGAHALLDRVAAFATLLDTNPADLRVPCA